MKQILKWTGIVLLVPVVVGLVVNALFVSTTEARLQRQLAAIRAEGDPLTMADLARKPIPPETNADTYLRQAEPGVKAICDLLYPDTNNSVVKRLAGAVQSALLKPGGKTELPLTPADLDAMSSYEDKKWEQSYGGWSGSNPHPPMPRKLQKTLRMIFADHAEVIPLLEKAAACPDNDAQFDYSLPPKELLGFTLPTRPRSLSDIVQKMRSAARVLNCRADLLVAEGKRDEAVRSALTLFRLARHCGRNPTAISHLVAVTIAGMAVDCANTALQSGPVSPEIRKELDAELALQDRMDGFAWAIKSERAMFIASFQTTVPCRNWWLIGRGYWNRQESNCLDVFAAFLAMANASASWREAERTIEDKGFANASFLPREQGSACRAYYQVALRIRAMIRSLRVLNALPVTAAGGKIPKLAELGLPVDATIDPFSGKPLYVKRKPQGWLVYSVGSNLVDDGGKVEDPTNGDVGIGSLPPTKPGEPAKR